MRRKEKRLLQVAGLLLAALLFLPNVGLWSLYRDRMFENSPGAQDGWILPLQVSPGGSVGVRGWGGDPEVPASGGAQAASPESGISPVQNRLVRSRTFSTEDSDSSPSRRLQRVFPTM